MKKLALYKDAADFAFANLALTDSLAISQAANEHFVAQKYDSRDYPYWLQCFSQCKQQFTQLSLQPTLSAQLDAQAAAKAAASQPIAEK